jgi:hypothetical protein
VVKIFNFLNLLMLDISKHCRLVYWLVVMTVDPMGCRLMIGRSNNRRVMIRCMIITFLLHSITVPPFLGNIRTVQILVIRDTFGVFHMLRLQGRAVALGTCHLCFLVVGEGL